MSTLNVDVPHEWQVAYDVAIYGFPEAYEHVFGRSIMAKVKIDMHLKANKLSFVAINSDTRSSSIWRQQTAKVDTNDLYRYFNQKGDNVNLLVHHDKSTIELTYNHQNWKPIMFVNTDNEGLQAKGCFDCGPPPSAARRNSETNQSSCGFSFLLKRSNSSSFTCGVSALTRQPQTQKNTQKGDTGWQWLRRKSMSLSSK